MTQATNREPAVQAAADSEQHAGTAELLQQPIPAPVLKLLLGRLKVSVEMGALHQACTQAEQTLPASPPAQRIGFIVKTLQLKGVQAAALCWRRFDQRRLPALVFVQDSWQLVERAEDDQLMLTDERGQSQLLREDTLETATVLWLRTAPQQQSSSIFSLRGNIAARLVWSEIFKSRRWVGDVMIATILVNVLAISTSLFAMQVYDRVVPTLAYATLWTLVTGMAIVVALDWGLKSVRARILDSVASAVDKAVSQQVFDHVLHLQLDTRPRSLGTLAAQVGGLDAVRQFFSSGVIFVLVDMPFALMFIGFIAIIGGHIGWVYLLLLPVAAILGWITQLRLRRLMQQQMMRANERQGFLVDAIQGTESIRASNAGWRFSEQWQTLTASIASYNIRQKAISNLATVTTGSLSTVAYISALVVGVGQIEAGNLSMGALIACSILGGRVIAPVAQSVQYLAQWQNISQALQLVNQVLKLDTERRPDQQLLMPEQAPEHIELEGVRFSYADSPVQHLNIDHLRLNAGDRIALLGPVGSGKSTLLKVLAGLYRPSAGRVRLGNADLWEIDPHVVADQVAYLPQSVHLFKGTLRSNLALSGAVSDSHLLQVVRELGIDKIADDNPHSMDLAISEGGEGLSGGQRQLVGLGRVFLAQPKIWLLDEPTAALDQDSTQQVMQALKSHVQPQDILLISTHRLALASQLASRVLLMQGGEVVADGKPEQVLPRMMASQSSHAAKGRAAQMPAGHRSGPMNRGPNHVI
jgi:ATP-binding cassette subfamily C protein LapB